MCFRLSETQIIPIITRQEMNANRQFTQINVMLLFLKMKSLMKKYLIPIIAMLLASCNMNTQSNNTVCTHLHTPKNTGELLKQLYDNAGSDCFNHLDKKSLSEIWTIPIISPQTTPKEQRQIQFDKLKAQSVCTSRLDGIFIEFSYYEDGKENISLHINDCYNKKYGGFNTDETLLSYLPEPQKRRAIYISNPPYPQSSSTPNDLPNLLEREYIYEIPTPHNRVITINHFLLKNIHEIFVSL